MEKHNISVLISEEEVQKRVRELAAQISKDYEGESVKLICILKGSVFFTCELAKRITVPVILDFMQVSSYGSQTVSSGTLKVKKELDEPIEGDNVIIVEDIIDSGNTLSRLVPMLQERNPKSLKVCTLLDKPERREVDVKVDYNGFNIPDKFVVGYGLDYDQNYRNLLMSSLFTPSCSATKSLIFSNIIKILSFYILTVNTAIFSNDVIVKIYGSSILQEYCPSLILHQIPQIQAGLHFAVYFHDSAHQAESVYWLMMYFRIWTGSPEICSYLYPIFLLHSQ